MSNVDWPRMVTAETMAAASRVAKYEALKDYRWNIETGGVEVEGLGRVSTSRESQSQMHNAIAGVERGGLSEPISWSVGEAWFDLTKDQIVSLAKTVSRHVQDCFDAQRIVADQMNELEDLSDFDQNAAFDVALADLKA